MFFRFGSAVCVVVLISLIGLAIEKRSLALRRQLSRQHYQMDILRDKHARLRLQSQELATIERLFEHVEQPDSGLAFPEKPRERASAVDSDSRPRAPLLFWRQPLDDPRRKASAGDARTNSPPLPGTVSRSQALP